ncbi:MAG: DNA-formamidopyrimidine glycosylase [Bacillota bacterium]
MPELPEVETIRTGLEPYLTGSGICDVEILYPKVLKDAEPEEVRKRICGQKGVSLKRRGKYLIWELSSGDRLVFHLRMTGQLVLTDPQEDIRKHTSFIIRLDAGLELRLTDTRKFAFMYLWKKERESPPGSLGELGPEPLEEGFTPVYLRGLCTDSKTRIKNLLLDQAKIAGIGNIYADESLFRAGINPRTPAGELSAADLERLHRTIREILREAIAYRGTTKRDYLDGFGAAGAFQERLLVYGRKGEKCVRCGRDIVRSVLGSRGTYYCPVCQREKAPKKNKGRE